MKYTIPFSYTTNCTIEVDASSLDEAISKVSLLSQVDADGYSKLLHVMPYSVNSTTKIDADSVEIDEEKAEELNPKQTYAVRLKRVQEVTVYVEAHSEDDAESEAIDKYESDDIEDEFEDCEVEAVEIELND